MFSFPLRSMKLAIVSAVWKRPEVLELFATGIRLLKENSPLEIYVILSGSEGAVSRKMVENHGFLYIEMPNEPLALKMNAPVLKAKELNVDYVLCLGSDDIISPELMRVYEREMGEDYDFIGVLDWYFYDTETKKALYWGGYREPYRKGHTCGAGRVISKRLMEAWNWQPWEVKDSLMLDSSMQDKLKATEHSWSKLSLLEEGVFALDIKSSTNMTPFKNWDNTCEIDVDVIKKHFPYLW